MIFEAVIARAGLQTYRRDGREITEYRDPAEVFAPEHVRSYEHAAITDFHPEEDHDCDGHVTIENRERLERGSVVPGSIRRDGNNLIAKLHITSHSLLLAMKNGRNAVSCGYDQDLVSEPGHTPDGARYDARQTKMRGNHVAIVDVARAGDVARVRMDSATNNHTTENRPMFKTIEEATAAYNAEKLRADAATDQLTASKTATTAATKRADEADAAKDAALAKAEKAEKLRADGEKAGKAAAKARVSLEEKAVKVLRVDSTDADALAELEAKSDLELKVSMIEALTGKALDATKAKNGDYVAARYDAAIEAEGEADAAIVEVRQAVRESGAQRKDSGSEGRDKARAEFQEARDNAWKNDPYTSKKKEG